MKKTLILVGMSVLFLTLFACTTPATPPEPTTPAAWLGSYAFHEGELEYTITVFLLEERYYATVQVDGEHPIRLLATVEGDGEEIALIFMNNLPGNAHNMFHAGDVLLSLRMQGDDVMTAWGALRPLGGSPGEGVYFIRQAEEPAEQE